MTNLEVLNPSKNPSESGWHPFSPPAVIDRVRCRDFHVHVVRDDLLPGGTKQRACAPFLQTLAADRAVSFVYASPFAGFAQVALASVCAPLGYRCVLYCESDRTQPGLMMKHPFTAIAESFGAEIVLLPTLADAERAAGAAVEASPEVLKIPLGFDCPEFRASFDSEIRRQWRIVCGQVGFEPKRVWLPVGSGTLASVFRGFLSGRTELCCVDVRVLNADDDRVARIARDPGIHYFQTPEKFHERADRPPGLPSNMHYDAKIWRFIEAHGQDGDLWWNVAR